MTAEGLAELVNARRIGSGKWQARCPAHADRHPSLTITQGNSGILLRCWSQSCDVAQICAALGLSVRNLFTDAHMTPEQRTEAAWLKSIRNEQERRQHAIQHARNDRVYKLEKLVDYIGAQLARRPEDLELARLFHLAVTRLHEAETEASLPHEDGPKRLEPPTAVPSEMTAALSEVGRRFDERRKGDLLKQIAA